MLRRLAACCISAGRGRGPSMYEMEGPRRLPRCPGCRLPGQAARRLPRGPSRPIARLLYAAWRHRCQIPAVRASRPALPAFPRSPPGRIPSSVVRDFYCGSSARHKAFPGEVQDSLAIHKTSVVYPLSTTNLHGAIHNLSTGTVDKWNGGQPPRTGASCSDRQCAQTGSAPRPAVRPDRQCAQTCICAARSSSTMSSNLPWICPCSISRCAATASFQ